MIQAPVGDQVMERRHQHQLPESHRRLHQDQYQVKWLYYHYPPNDDEHPAATQPSLHSKHVNPMCVAHAHSRYLETEMSLHHTTENHLRGITARCSDQYEAGASSEHPWVNRVLEKIEFGS